MTGTVVVGAELVVGDRFSLPLDRLLEKLDKTAETVSLLQGRFDKLSIAGVVKKLDAQWGEIARISDRGVARMEAKFDGLSTAADSAWAKVAAGADGAFKGILEASGGFSTELATRMDAAGADAVKAMAVGFERSSADMFAPVIAAARSATAEVSAIMVEAGRATSIAARSNVGYEGAAASLASRTAAAHGVHGAHASGLHFSGLGTHIGGSHVRASGDGIVPAVAGLGMLEVVKHATEGAMEYRHWETMFKGGGFSPEEVEKAKSAAWANAMSNHNVSSTDALKSLYEMIKVFPKAGETGPSVDEAARMLPLFSGVMVGLESVKAEGLHSRFAEGRQVYDLAKGLEETGVTQRGATPEIREAATKHMLNELFKTMLSERGVTDGSSFYALTNNSGGAAENWDERMATVVAPIIGSVMRHSKAGNADYMGLRTFQQGTITSKAVEGLLKYGAIDLSDTYTDSKGIHLNPNSAPFKGMEKNLWTWSSGMLDRLKTHGLDINSQEAMNEFINVAGSNKSTTGLLRTLLEPATRSQIAKDMYARDQVKDSALGMLEANDPVLKMEAVGKSFSNFFAAFGAGLVDPAIKGLTEITSAVDALAKAAANHPDITKYVAGATAVAGTALLGYGGGKMLGLFGGANAELTKAALMLQEAAVAQGAKGAPGWGGGSGFWGKVTGALGVLGLAEFAQGQGALLPPKSFTKRGVLDAIEPGLGNLFLGREGGFHTPSGYDREMRARMGGDGLDHSLDGVILGSNDAGKKLGELKDHTGFVLTSFDGLDKGVVGLTGRSGGLDNALKVLEATAMGAARQLASVAMSGGGMGGGSGFMNASWGGGGFGAGSYGGPPILGGGAAAGEEADYIRALATKYGIDPRVAVAVAKSEGLGVAWGTGMDHGTSFGAFQLHVGGGLGDIYRRVMGKDPRDQHNWRDMDDFALRWASQHGWGDWHGAARIGVHGMYGIGRAPTVDGRGTGPRTVAPGKPASAPADGTTASAMPPIVIEHHSHTYMDGKKIAHEVTRHQVADARFKRSLGAADNYGRRAHPGSEVMDA